MRKMNSHILKSNNSCFTLPQNCKVHWVLMAHACNLSYSGGRDQEDQGLKSAPSNSSRDPTQKYPTLKRTGGVAQVIESASEFRLARAKP
jgi:hypothetical protein